MDDRSYNMESLDWRLDKFFFKEPIVLLFTDGARPVSSVVNNMEELTDLMDKIQENKWQAGIGAMTLEFQLWFALARHAKMFEENLGQDT